MADRVLGFQAHPDLNCGFQQEISEPEYFKFGVIGLDFHKTAFSKCQDISLDNETQNMFLGVIREFIQPVIY